MTPLRQRMLDALVLRGMAARTQEAYIGAVHHRGAWLFGALRDPSRPIDTGSAQRWHYLARDAAGITKRGGIHSLRHAYATHLLEAGYDLDACSSGSATTMSAPPRAICT